MRRRAGLNDNRSGRFFGFASIGALTGIVVFLRVFPTVEREAHLNVLRSNQESGVSPADRMLAALAGTIEEDDRCEISQIVESAPSRYPELGQSLGVEEPQADGREKKISRGQMRAMVDAIVDAVIRSEFAHRIARTIVSTASLPDCVMELRLREPTLQRPPRSGPLFSGAGGDAGKASVEESGYENAQAQGEP